MIKVKTKSIVSQKVVIMNRKQKRVNIIFAYIFLKKLALRNIYVALCTAADILYVPGIYTMQPLEGCAAYIIEQEGLGVEVHTTTATRPSDILENPLPCQKRKGCDI